MLQFCETHWLSHSNHLLMTVIWQTQWRLQRAGSYLTNKTVVPHYSKYLKLLANHPGDENGKMKLDSIWADDEICHCGPGMHIAQMRDSSPKGSHSEGPQYTQLMYTQRPLIAENNTEATTQHLTGLLLRKEDVSITITNSTPKERDFEDDTTKTGLTSNFQSVTKNCASVTCRSATVCQPEAILWSRFTSAWILKVLSQQYHKTCINLHRFTENHFFFHNCTCYSINSNIVEAWEQTVKSGSHTWTNCH